MSVTASTGAWLADGTIIAIEARTRRSARPVGFRCGGPPRNAPELRPSARVGFDRANRSRPPTSTGENAVVGRSESCSSVSCPGSSARDGSPSSGVLHEYSPDRASLAPGRPD